MLQILCEELGSLAQPTVQQWLMQEQILSPDTLGTQSIPATVMDKHNFTALPQWKFDDMYRLDPQIKQSVSTRNNNSS